MATKINRQKSSLSPAWHLILSRVRWLRRVLDWQSDLLHLTTKYNWQGNGLIRHVETCLSGPPRPYNSRPNISQLCSHCIHRNRSSGILCQHCPGCCRTPGSLPFFSQSQSHVTTYDQSVSKSWIRAPCGSRDRILISVWHLRVSFYRLRAPSLTRGRVCHLS
jgi:hypothetical protein